MSSRTRFGRGRRRPRAASVRGATATGVRPSRSGASLAGATLSTANTTRPSLSGLGLVTRPEVVIDPGSVVLEPGGTPQIDPDALFGDYEGGFLDNPAFRLSRDADQLEVHVQCFGLRAEWSPGQSGAARLKLIDSEKSATVVLGFGPPHIAEDTALQEEGSFSVPDTLPAKRAGGLSKVVLRWPARLGACGLDTKSLLTRFSTLGLVVPARGHATRPPSKVQRTTLELPWRVHLAPDVGGHTRLRLPAERVSSNGWNELATSRFTDRQGNLEVAWRAVDSPDYQPPNHQWGTDTHLSPVPGGGTMRASLTKRNRSELVHLTDNPTQNAALESVRSPARGPVALTLFGADARLRGEWGGDADDPPQTGAGVNLLAWDHDVRGGRDQRVKVVTAGVVFPFGFPAALVTLTEREVRGEPAVAWSVMRYYLVIRRPVVEVQAAGSPFVRFEVLEDPSALLDDPTASNVQGLSSEQAFWVRSGGSDLPLVVQATDRAGGQVTLRSPVVFVGGAAAKDVGIVGTIQHAWTSDLARHAQHLGSASVAYAGSADVDAILPTTVLALKGSGGVPISPRLAQAEVQLPALKGLGAASSTVALTYTDAWTGGAPNAGGVWAEFVDTVVSSPAARFAGGMAAMQLQMQGLALGHGPVAAVGAAIQGNYLDALSVLLGQTTLLGGLSLRDLVDAATRLGTVQVGDGALRPRITFDPRTASTHLHWEPVLGDFDAGFVAYAPRAGLPQDHLLCAELDASGAWKVETRLTNFTLTFAGAIALDFNVLGYSDSSASAQDVDVDLEEVRFSGALEFVNELRDLLRFGDGLAVDVRGLDIEASLSFSVPTMTLGMFELADLAVSSRLQLPLDGSGPTVGFGISSRDRPFLVAVCGVGGGGWLDMELHTGGLKALEVGLFAAGSMSLNLGVASGGATIKVGVVFGYDGQTGTSVVTASIEVNGVLTVLGLITVSASFYLGLTYSRTSGGKAELTGTASLRVKVSVLFFSTSVTLSVERRLAGSDPPFTAQVSQRDWLKTWAAYAA